MTLQRKEHNEMIAMLKAQIEHADKKSQNAAAAAERQERMQAALEKNNSALILQRDENSGQELSRIQTIEIEKLAMEIEAAEHRSRIQSLLVQLEERERDRLMAEGEYARRISARQLQVATGSLAFAALTFLSCTVM
jgi:hypothetical protein